MPAVVITGKKQVEAEYKAIQELQQKCENCRVFKGKEADETFIYKVLEYQSEEGYVPTVAIARYGNIYAIQPPDYLKGKQWTVLEFVLRELKNSLLVVFSPETYKYLGKYSYGKPLNVQLFVW